MNGDFASTGTWADKVEMYPDFTLEAMAEALGCSMVSGDLLQTCFMRQSTGNLIQLAGAS